MTKHGVHKKKKIIFLSRFFSLIFIGLLIVIPAYTWIQEFSQKQSNLEERTDLVAEQLEIMIEQNIGENVAIMDLLQHFWTSHEYNPLTIESEFYSVIPDYFDKFEGVHAISWINITGILKYYYPIVPNNPHINQSVWILPSNGTNVAFQYAYENLEMGMYLYHTRHSDGYMMYYPLLTNHTLTGFFSVTFRINEFVDHIINEVPILQDFYIQIQDSENFIFFTHNHTHNEFEYTVDFFIPFYYSWWQLKICPTERLQNEASPLGSWQILLLGLGFSILGFLTYITLLLGKKNLKKEFQEKSKLEEELFQAQKMESLGTLAGGIVHDSNNILMGIQGYISLLTEDLLNLDESSEQVNSFKKESDFYISGMNDAIERARNLNRQILQFSRYKTQDKKVIDTKFALKTLIQVFSQTIDKRIEVETKFTANPIFLLIDPTIFQQIILNILINSRDAMPNGGILSISCNIIQKKFQLATQPLEWIQIQIKDTGIGIKKENISRVFDPFFTTKDKNSGTGLGLSIVYRAMKKIGGQININSEEHEGTTINLYFPYVHSLKLEKSRIISPKIINKFVFPGLNILIIDDEIPIITLFVKYLTNLQIEVDAISNPNNIMSHYSNYSNKYHLILLDVNLPKISGPEIYMKMKAINPDQKVIFITGYSEYEIDQTNKNILGVILKPFNFSEIKTALFKHFPEFHQKLSEI